MTGAELAAAAEAAYRIGGKRAVFDLLDPQGPREHTVVRCPACPGTVPRTYRYDDGICELCAGLGALTGFAALEDTGV